MSAVTMSPKMRRLRLSLGQTIITIILVFLLVLTFVPIVYLAVLALKDNGQIYGRFWSMPNPYRWENFALGWAVIGRSIVNSIITSGSACATTLLLSSLSGYVFARHPVPAKEIIYTGSWPLLMTPPSDAIPAMCSS